MKVSKNASKNRFALAEHELIEMLADLNLIVVSLDRIGSSADTEKVASVLIGEFLLKRDFFKRMASMRRVLSKAFDVGASPEAQHRLETRLSRLRYWKP